MKYIECPTLGRRPYSEFAISGILEPEPSERPDMGAARWAFDRHSVPTVRTEWWYHTPSQLWFKVTRDTGNDRIAEVELAGLMAKENI
ncbi:MAG: sarcosine oxidase subunit delta [Pseudomonadota bacterium]